MKYRILILFILLVTSLFSKDNNKCFEKLGNHFVEYNNKIFSIEDVESDSSFLDEIIEKKIRNLELKDNLSEIKKRKILKINGKYIFIGDKVFYLNMEIENVDVGSFEILSENISKDKNNIYYRYYKLGDIDSKNFKILDRYHFTDGKYIFYISQDELGFESFHIIRDVDIKTYKIIDKFYSKDKNNVFYEDSIIEGADPKNFVKINSFYSKDKSNVYYKNFVIKEADLNSFKILNNGYSKDKNNIYWRNYKVSDYKNSNFKILDDGIIIVGVKLYQDWYEAYKNDVKTLKKIGKYLWIDKNGIYYVNNERMSSGIRMSDKIENFNFRKFKKLKNDYYIYNDSIIFYNDKILSKDSKNFKILSKNYSKDSENIYYKDSKIYGVDLKTFEIVSEKYAKDKNNVYYRNSIMKNINPKNFRKIDCDLIVDDNNIYDIDK